MIGLLPLLAFAVVALPAAAAETAPTVPANPARVAVSFAPDPVAPGAEGTVTVKLEAIDGIKINKYPKVRLQVPAKEGLVLAAEGSVGSDTLPDVEKPELNYFDPVDPLRVTLKLDPAASRGTHAIPGRLTYFYCVVASGFCTQHRVAVRIPVTVR
jgi:hypothetical protein